jgi:hypothetical protein
MRQNPARLCTEAHNRPDPQALAAAGPCAAITASSRTP